MSDSPASGNSANGSTVGSNVKTGQGVVVGLLACVIGLQRGGLFAFNFILLGAVIIFLALSRGKLDASFTPFKRVFIVLLVVALSLGHRLTPLWRTRATFAVTCVAIAVLFWPAPHPKSDTLPHA